MEWATGTFCGDYKSQYGNTGQSYAYIVLAFPRHKLVSDADWCFAATMEAHFILGDDYESLPGCQLVEVDGIRGFRNRIFR